MRITTFLLAASVLGQAPDDAAPRELLADAAFRRGFMLTAASHPAPKVEIGVLHAAAAGTDDGVPAWRLAQWATRERLEPGRCAEMGGGRWLAENRAKRVEITRPASGPAGILLEVKGDYEYGGRLRAEGEPWPHLLIEQRFPAPIVLADFHRLTFAMEARIPSCKPASWSDGRRDPGLHTAQVSAYWTVHDASQGGTDRGDMIWFGIPFFDARHAIPPGHFAIDAGKADATGKFICLLDGSRFWRRPTGDGGWQRLEVDMQPLLREALAIAKRQGHLTRTRYEDLSIDTFNLGWEVPGPYDAAVEVRGLSLRGVGKGPRPATGPSAGPAERGRASGKSPLTIP